MQLCLVVCRYAFITILYMYTHVPANVDKERERAGERARERERAREKERKRERVSE